MERKMTQLEKEDTLEDDHMITNSVKPVQPQTLVSVAEKKRMLHYMQNDINVQLTDFISKTITTRPPDFYDFAINELQEQKAIRGSLPPSAKGGMSPNKLAPLPTKIEETKSPRIAESPRKIDEELTNHHRNLIQESVSSPDLVSRKVTMNVNRNLELYNALEDAKLEIESLKASIKQISVNIQEGIML